MGASGRILVLWNSSVFIGVVFDKRQFGLSVLFTSVLNGEKWKLTNVYGHCHEPDRSDFI
jgi:hypothetical protein